MLLYNKFFIYAGELIMSVINIIQQSYGNMFKVIKPTLSKVISPALSKHNLARKELSIKFFEVVNTLKTACINNRSITAGGVTLILVVIALRVIQKRREQNSQLGVPNNLTTTTTPPPANPPKPKPTNTTTSIDKASDQLKKITEDFANNNRLYTTTGSSDFSGDDDYLVSKQFGKEDNINIIPTDNSANRRSLNSKDPIEKPTELGDKTPNQELKTPLPNFPPINAENVEQNGPVVSIYIDSSEKVEAAPAELQKFDEQFTKIHESWTLVANCIQLDLANFDTTDIDKLLKERIEEVQHDLNELLKQLIQYGKLLQDHNLDSRPRELQYMDAEILSRGIKAISMIDNLTYASGANMDRLNPSIVPPGGAENGSDGGFNTCYIAVALHMLRIGYRSRLDGILPDENSNSDLQDPQEIAQIDEILPDEDPHPKLEDLQEIAQMAIHLSQGITLTGDQMLDLAGKFNKWKVMKEGVGEQACAFQLFQSLLDMFGVQNMGIQKVVEVEAEKESESDLSQEENVASDNVNDNKLEEVKQEEPELDVEIKRILTTDIPRTLDCSILNKGNKATSLTEALEFEFGNHTTLDPSYLPDVLPVYLKRTDYVPPSDEPQAPIVTNSDLDNMTIEEIIKMTMQEDLSDQKGIIKIDDNVIVDDLWVIPRKFISGNCPVVYQLKGFVMHGSKISNKGHYIAYTQQAGTWYCLNNQVSKEVLDAEQRKEDQNKALFYIFQRVNLSIVPHAAE